MIEALVPGKVAEILVLVGGSVRRVKMSLTHAAKWLGKTVKLWDVASLVSVSTELSEK